MTTSIQRAVVAATYARSLLDYLRALGEEPQCLYPPERIAQIESTEMHGPMPLLEWAEMFQRAIAYTGDIDLPLKVGGSIRPRHLGVLGYVLMSCTNLAEAAMQLARYLRLVGEISTSELTREGGRAALCWHWPHDTRAIPAFEQSSLAARISFARWLSGRQDLHMDAHFSFDRPADIRVYEKMFGGDLHFGQPLARLVFPVEVLHWPVTMANAEARRSTEELADSVLERIAGEPEFLQQLRAVLSRELSAGRASLETAAQALNISPRTLHRRIEEHGSSFRVVLDELRRAHAEAYLRQGCVSLTEIAFMLGYAEQSSFQQAFRRWSGMTPAEYRRRLDGTGEMVGV